ncbi:MAG: transglutaminase domain-containing protein [Bacteroidales bacterium]|nr:transglutaminase domain-containing protein [Bacteroidales bacterium]
MIQVLISLMIGGLAANAEPQTNRWIENDSAEAIRGRIARDFSLPYQQGARQIMEEHTELSRESIDSLAQCHRIEAMEIGGEKWMFRKAQRNLNLLDPRYNNGWSNRGSKASKQRMAFADSVVQCSRGAMADGGAHRVKYKFTIDVPYIPELKDDTLRVWMPFPRETERQKDITLISAYPTEYVLSANDQSVHSTIYMEQPVGEGETAHFEYVVEFTGMGKYVATDYILSHIQPYDKEGELYRQYTAMDSPHIVRMDSLAHAIVGEESNPYKQSELVYDYIVSTYPWAGAREYSTIPCIPEYVVETGHGDCGQVALLYISLMRTLGVPARWESGWMLHPGEKNLHDWAEVYFEGVGWVPIDASFGRYTGSADPAVRNFYSTGIDAHRLICNQGVGGEFYPRKRYIRSETVDSQMGEVECTKGNLFYPLWNQHLEILSQSPIEPK